MFGVARVNESGSIGPVLRVSLASLALIPPLGAPLNPNARVLPRILPLPFARPGVRGDPFGIWRTKSFGSIILPRPRDAEEARIAAGASGARLSSISSSSSLPF